MITAFKKKVHKSNNSLWAKQPKMEWGGWRKKDLKHSASPKKLQSCKSQINSLNHPSKQKHLIYSLARINHHNIDKKTM